MSETIVVAILSLVGTALGSGLSILAANKLTNYKIDELQKKVEKHNNLIERTFRLEERETVLETRVDQLERGAAK